MNIEIKEQNGSFIGILQGRLDSEKASHFMEELEPLMANADKEIELDCSKLEYICSLGLRGLMQLNKEIAAKGGHLVLTHVMGEVQNVFTLTGFFKLFEIK